VPTRTIPDGKPAEFPGCDSTTEVFTSGVPHCLGRIAPFEQRLHSTLATKFIVAEATHLPAIRERAILMEMVSIYEMIPDPKGLLALEPEELAGVILEYLNSLAPDDGRLNRYNFSLPHTYQQYPPESHRAIGRALMEAWVWLEREGLIAPDPNQSGGEWVFVTRRGAKVKDRTGLMSYRRASVLPRELLHPRLATKVMAPFLRGEYDVAVFQAFKEVEVGVREAGRFEPEDIGVKLMRAAFDPKIGPLRDPAEPEPEREATAHIFAGAIGRYKNPQSHRDAPITDAGESVELLLLASHLLRIVDARTAAAGPTARPDA
jgi:uncharacterized protein (TIGR02391 family)